MPTPDSTTEEPLADLPGFLPPPRRPMGPDPILEGHQTTLPPTMPAGSDPSQFRPLREDDSPSDFAGIDEGEATIPTPTSPSGSFRGSTANASVFVGFLSLGVGIASVVVARARTAKRGPEIGNVWVATDEEAAAIAEPLARITARHVPLGDVLEDSDVADGIEALMATAGYAIANVAEEAEMAKAVADAGGTRVGEQDDG